MWEGQEIFRSIRGVAWLPVVWGEGLRVVLEVCNAERARLHALTRGLTREEAVVERMPGVGCVVVTRRARI